MEGHGAPKLSRKHDFQRLVDRRESNSDESPFAQELSRRTSIQQKPSMGFSTRLQKSARPMTSPDIYISIPPADASNSRTPRYTHEAPRIGVFSIPDAPERVDDDSDASSICHSPSWEDSETKKLRKLKQEVKEKRRKERERLAKEAKKAEAPLKRLTKPSPPNNLSKMVILADRTTSAHADPTLFGLSHEKGGRSKNDSLDLKGFMEGTNRISGPWNTPIAEPEKTVPVKSSDGFIGGLKLKILERAASQERKGDRQSVANKTRTLSNGDGAESVGGKPEDVGVEVNGKGSVGQPGQFSSSAMIGPRIGPTKPAETIPIIEEDVRDESIDKISAPETPKSKPANSAPLQDQKGSPTSSKSTGNAQRPPRSSRHSRISSQERPPTSYREPLELAQDVPRGRERSSSYVGNQRHQHGDSSDDKGASSSAESTQSKRRSWSIASLTRRARRSTSKPRPSTGDSENSNASNEEDVYHAFLVDNYASSQPLPNLLNRSEDGRPTTSGQTKLSYTTNSLKGFRNVAKAAFARHSAIPTSFRKSSVIFKDPGSKKLRAMASNMSLKSGSSKADRILGASVTSLMDGRPLTSSAALGSSSHDRSNGTLMPSPLGELEKALQSPARSTTESSEGSPDESTNATTPTGSRPASHNRSSRETFSKSPTSPMMSGGLLPYDETSRIDEEGLLETPLATKPKHISSLFQSKARPHGDQRRPSSSKEGAKSQQSEIQRHPSLSKSVSTPDLQQDLSFLPELKHQSLSRPGKQRDKTLPRLPIIETTAEHNSVIKSPRNEETHPIITSNVSNSNSNSSQHLQNARLNIPTPIPTKRRFPNVRDGPLPMASIEPIAKMFVVCCACRYFHDMPSKLYECMAKPDNVVEDRERGVSGVISTAVKCPWCAHGMSVACCEGYAAVVYLRERLH